MMILGPSRERPIGQCSSRQLSLVAVLVAAVCPRLIGVTQPFVDAWSWRQSDVAMIAENFYRNGFNIFWPQVNWAGPSAGYVGTEFPLVPFLAALFYPLLGVHEWIGRSLSIGFFAASLTFLILLIETLIDTPTALISGALYSLLPLCVFASRAFMPDMAALAFSMAALYFFVRWEPGATPRLLVWTCCATTLAALVKPPAIILGVPMLYLAAVRGQLKDVRLWAAAAAALVPPTLWYLHALHVSRVYEPHHFFGSGGVSIVGLAEYRNIFTTAATTSLTPLASLAMLPGAIYAYGVPRLRCFHWWLAALLTFTIVAGLGHRHQWYLLPVAPIVSVFATMALRRGGRLIRRRPIAYAGLLSFIALLGAWSYSYLRADYGAWAEPARQAGLQIQATTPPGALIMFVDEGDPTGLYYSHRKGWHVLRPFGSIPFESEDAISELERLRSLGGRYLAITRLQFWWLDYYVELRRYLECSFRRAGATPDYILFESRPGRRCESAWNALGPQPVPQV